jgi:spore germination cell wall hydrolase CwlJ-like protein
MVVLTGITEDGLITVNDPYGPNYTKWELADGFENGFEEVDVKTGFAGAWIFEEYEEPPVVPTRYPGVELTTEEEYLLASIIWLESRGESFEGQQAIAEIVLNRLIAEGFPNTIHDVIFAENQFTTTAFLDDAKPGEIQYKAIKTALTGESVLPVDVYYFGRYPKNDRIWGIIGGHTFCYRG